MNPYLSFEMPAPVYSFMYKFKILEGIWPECPCHPPEKDIQVEIETIDPEDIDARIKKCLIKIWIDGELFTTPIIASKVLYVAEETLEWVGYEHPHSWILTPDDPLNESGPTYSLANELEDKVYSAFRAWYPKLSSMLMIQELFMSTLLAQNRIVVNFYPRRPNYTGQIAYALYDDQKNKNKTVYFAIQASDNRPINKIYTDSEKAVEELYDAMFTGDDADSNVINAIKTELVEIEKRLLTSLSR